MIANFTQFLRPDGQEVQAGCEVSDDLKEQLDAMKSVGVRLTAEVLATSEVSLAVEHPDHGDFDSSVVPNGPDVSGAVDKLIRRFDRSAFETWVNTAEAEAKS